MVYGGMIKSTPTRFRNEKHRVKEPSWGAASAMLLLVFVLHLWRVSPSEIVGAEGSPAVVSERGKGIRPVAPFLRRLIRGNSSQFCAFTILRGAYNVMS